MGSAAPWGAGKACVTNTKGYRGGRALPTRGQSAAYPSAICSMVGGGAGVSIIEPVTARQCAALGMVAIRPITPEQFFTYDMLTPALRPASRLVQDLADRVRREFEDRKDSRVMPGAFVGRCFPNGSPVNLARCRNALSHAIWWCSPDASDNMSKLQMTSVRPAGTTGGMAPFYRLSLARKTAPCGSRNRRNPEAYCPEF